MSPSRMRLEAEAQSINFIDRFLLPKINREKDDEKRRRKKTLRRGEEEEEREKSFL